MDLVSPGYGSPLVLASALACFTLWLGAYVCIIRRGILDRTYGMPLVPLCVNLSYEFIFGVLYPDQPPLNLINVAWFVFDLGIVGTYLRYGRREWPDFLPRWTFVPFFALVLGMSFWGVLAVTWQFGDRTGSFSGWGDALLIPCCFVAMLFRRGIGGQTIYIAAATWLGTLALIPLEVSISPDAPLLLFLYVAIAVSGLLYLVFLFAALRRAGVNPWRRW